jgi:hypothetical protein
VPNYISVTGETFAMPGVCACCGRPTTETHTFEKKKRLFVGVATLVRTMSLTVPYCSACEDHAVWYANSAWFGLAIVGLMALIAWSAIAAVPLVVGAAVYPGLTDHLVVRLLAVAFVGGGTYFSCWLRWRKRPRRPLGREHVSKGWAFEIVTFKKDSARLKLDSFAFAKSFVEANPGTSRRG